MYAVLLAQGRAVPQLRERQDRVEITIGRHILDPQIIDVMGKVNQSYQLAQRETICLGLLAQHEQMSARDLVAALMLDDVDELRHWVGQLQELGLVKSVGRTKATRYFVPPEVMRDLALPTTTTLARIEPHRLQALVLEDLRRYPESAIGEINNRVGPEINSKQLKRAIDGLVAAGQVAHKGEKRWRRYRLAS